MDKMRECPFCGGGANLQWARKYESNKNNYWVSCDECYCVSGYDEKDGDAIVRWNTRAYDAEIAELKEKQHYLYSIALLGMGKEDRLKEKLQIARDALASTLKIDYGYSSDRDAVLGIVGEALAQIEDK